MANFEYLITRPGIFKLTTIILGIIAFTLASYSYADSPYTEFYSNQTELEVSKTLPGTELELYNVTISGTFLGISIAYLVLYAFIYELCESTLNRMVDTGYHMTGALLIFSGACVNFYSALEIQGYGCSLFETISKGPIPKSGVFSTSQFFCHHFDEKIVGSGFSTLNAILYCITGFIAFTTKDL